MGNHTREYLWGAVGGMLTEIYTSHCSHVCKKCGSLLSPILVKSLPPHTPQIFSHLVHPSEGPFQWKCQMCSDGGVIEVISVAHVFRYLVAELAAAHNNVTIHLVYMI